MPVRLLSMRADRCRCMLSSTAGKRNSRASEASVAGVPRHEDLQHAQICRLLRLQGEHGARRAAEGTVGQVYLRRGGVDNALIPHAFGPRTTNGFCVSGLIKASLEA